MILAEVLNGHVSVYHNMSTVFTRKPIYYNMFYNSTRKCHKYRFLLAIHLSPAADVCFNNLD